MGLIVPILMMIPAFAVTTFIARRISSVGLAYAVAIVAGIAVLVLLFLVMTFWMSFALLNTAPSGLGFE